MDGGPFRVGQQVYLYRERDAEVQCRKCEGGGLLYDQGEDTRTVCTECLGAGTVPGTRAWVEGPLQIVRESFVAGAGWRYGVPGPDRIDDWPEAVLFARRGEAQRLVHGRDGNPKPKEGPGSGGGSG